MRNIFGDFVYFDDGFKLGIKGHICLKREDSFHYEKCEFFEIEIIKAFQLLGYSENSDFEITFLGWVERDIHSTLEYRSTYLCADTTYNLEHPKMQQLTEA